MVFSQTKSTQSDRVGDNNDLISKLQDTVDKIKIESEFAIAYGGYEPLTIPTHYHEHLKTISSCDRDRYLTVKLKNYLYNIYLDSEPQQDLELDIPSSQEANYVNHWSQTKFYQQLIRANCGKGYSDPGWLVVGQQADRWLVTKNGLTLQIKPDKYLADSTQKLEPEQVVALKMPHNLVDHGMYIAVGDAGKPEEVAGGSVTQLYFNVSAEGALLLLADLTQKLNQSKIPFTFNIAYDETYFDCVDAAILEFNKADFARICSILQEVYEGKQEYFQPDMPFFAKSLGLAGMSIAEKPHTTSEIKENIGQHHCSIIAQALLTARRDRVDLKLSYLLDCLIEQGVDPLRPYLNPGASDIYDLQPFSIE